MENKILLVFGFFLLWINLCLEWEKFEKFVELFFGWDFILLFWEFVVFWIIDLLLYFFFLECELFWVVFWEGDINVEFFMLLCIGL